MAMPGHRRDRITRLQGIDQFAQGTILRRGVRHLIGALEFDTDRVVVAIFPSQPGRPSGMPGAPVTIDKLHDLPITAHVKVRRHLLSGDFRKIRMRRRIELIEEKARHPVATKFVRRQADVVNDDQGNLAAIRSTAKIRRKYLPHPGQPTTTPRPHSIPSRSSR